MNQQIENLGQSAKARQETCSFISLIPPASGEKSHKVREERSGWSTGGPEEIAANSSLDLQRPSLGAPKGNRTDHAAQMPQLRNALSPGSHKSGFHVVLNRTNNGSISGHRELAQPGAPLAVRRLRRVALEPWPCPEPQEAKSLPLWTQSWGLGLGRPILVTGGCGQEGQLDICPVVWSHIAQGETPSQPQAHCDTSVSTAVQPALTAGMENPGRDHGVWWCWLPSPGSAVRCIWVPTAEGHI